MKRIAAELVKIADELDKMGLIKEANQITEILYKFADFESEGNESVFENIVQEGARLVIEGDMDEKKINYFVMSKIVDMINGETAGTILSTLSPFITPEIKRKISILNRNPNNVSDSDAQSVIMDTLKSAENLLSNLIRDDIWSITNKTDPLSRLMGDNSQADIPERDN